MGDLLGRLSPGLRPDILEGRTRFTYYAGDTRYSTTSFPAVSQHWSLIAHTEISAANARGPILVKGNQFGGMILMLDEAHPVFIYDPSGRNEERLVLRPAAALTTGVHEIRIDIKPGPAPRSGILTMSVDGNAVATADAPILYRVRGDAYIGRSGLGALPGGLPITALDDAKISAVEVLVDKSQVPATEGHH
jgi:arylsulfatase